LSPSFFSTVMVLLVAWRVAGMLVFRPVQLGLQDAAVTLGGIVLAVAMLMSPPTDRTLVSLNVVRDVLVVASLAYSLLFPAQGQLPCREDKCGIFGGMATGFYFHENVAATGALLLMPALLVAWSRLYVFSALTVMAVFVLATGSRTGLLCFAAGAAVVVVGQWRMEDEEGELVNPRPQWPWAFRSLPLVAYLGSLYLFLSASSDELTGRGVVYSGIRQTMHGLELLYGGGADVVERVSGGWVAGEHGQAPHLLVHTGVVGMLLFGLAMGAIAVMRHPTRSQFMGMAFLMVASAQFLTEPGWELSVRSMDFVSILLTTGLVAAHATRRPPADTEARGMTAANHPIGR